MTSVHPAAPLLVGGFLLLILPPRLRKGLMLALIGVSFINLLSYSAGDSAIWSLAGYDLQVVRVDKLSLLFGYLFHLATFLAAVFSLHLNDRMQHTTGILYAGSAIGAVFAGDLLTLFIFWELLAVTSVFQIWARRTPESLSAGQRYLLMHIASGLLLLTGAAIRLRETGTLDFERMSGDGIGEILILIAFGLKCGFPLLHTWLVDGYPAATPTGAVFLTAFTTKTAVYALARGFAGLEALIWIGAAMTLFPIFYAVIENDLRRVLSYSMINQIGFMVVGIGLGDGLGVNGAVAHAFNDVIFKGLLFMSMGAVLFRTGTIKASELGGLYKSMPWTTGCCLVGASSISAFPFFSGFVSKSMVMSEAAHEGYVWLWLVLLFASAGVLHHAGIKIPFYAFFAHDSGRRPKEAPLNMRVAMTIAAVLCIGIGCFPSALYRLLPFETGYNPYDVTHFVTQLQLLFFAALAFAVLKLTDIEPPELASVNLDADWVVRRLIPRTLGGSLRVISVLWRAALGGVRDVIQSLVTVTGWLHSPRGRLGEPWPTGTTAFWAALLLGVYLLFAFFGRAAG